ncbi:MAG TPA: DUF2085 domain-containing protein [Polyangiaceae bacterium]
MNSVHYRYLTYLCRGLGVLLLAWPFVPPALRAFGLDGAAFWLERPWMLTCHRLPERTMTFLGEKMPMCSRCAGLDLGAGLGLVLGRPYRGPMFLWVWLALASVLLLVEVYTQGTGLHGIWHPSRLATGMLLAFPVGAAVTAIMKRSSLEEGVS